MSRICGLAAQAGVSLRVHGPTCLGEDFKGIFNYQSGFGFILNRVSDSYMGVKVSSSRLVV